MCKHSATWESETSSESVGGCGAAHTLQDPPTAQLLLNGYRQLWACSHTVCFSFGSNHLPTSCITLQRSLLWFEGVSEAQKSYLSTMRSKVRLRKQSVRPFSPSSTSRPQGTQGNIITRGGPSLRRLAGYVPYPGDLGMDGEGGWGPQNKDRVISCTRRETTGQ